MLASFISVSLCTLLICMSLAMDSRAEEVIDAEAGTQETNIDKPLHAIDQTAEPLQNKPQQNKPQQNNAKPILLANQTAPSEIHKIVKPALNIDLSQPVIQAVPEQNPSDNNSENSTSEGIQTPLEQTYSTEPTAQQQDWLFLDTLIPPGTTTRLSWSPAQNFEGIATPSPVLVAHGLKQGPKLCLTGAVHGDELNGIEIVRRILYSIDAAELHGTVIGVPIVNLQGFLRSSRYLTDRRDLNRFFPGNQSGSSASRIAYSFFNQVIRHCDMLVDLHTGSFYRTNLPQLRANLKNKDVLELSRSFDAIAVLHSEGAVGTLRRAAVDAGIPAVTIEAGGPMELKESNVADGVDAINTLLDKRGMLDTLSFWGAPQPTYYGSIWVRADQGGILFSEIKLGAKVAQGELLGMVTDPITNIRSEIISPIKGRVLGMALNQVVQPGFAAYHIGMAAQVDGSLAEGELPAIIEQNQESGTEDSIDDIQAQD